MKMFGKSTGFKAEKAEVVRIRVKRYLLLKHIVFGDVQHTFCAKWDEDNGLLPSCGLLRPWHKCDGLMQPEYKKLCVDPQLTSFDIMRNLLARAFNIKSEFSISYLATDDKSQEVYLSMLSDWDLDAAFLGSSDPYLRLKVDLKPFEEGLTDWDLVSDANNAQRGTGRALLQDSAAIFGTLTGTITTHVGKTVTQVSKAMGLWNEEQKPPPPLKQPMTDAEFHKFMDGVGHMIQPGEFRLSVFCGGLDPALRKVVWRHLLNIFPENLSGKERFNYLQSKVREYYRLRDEWRAFFLKGDEAEDIRMVANMVKKDVLRTDRTHSYYAGSDDNKNVLSLFNLLVTYAVTHPDVLYCQGMSDIASPILMVEDDEAHAFICFCGLMTRLKSNFSKDGCAMMSKFQHLSLLLQHHDPDFFAYLKEHNADDMFFCYRWLLLELKREFPLDQTLHMLEIMWSSLPPNPPENELSLTDPEYQNAGIMTSPTSPSMASQAYMLLKSRLRKSSETANDLTTSPGLSSSGGNQHQAHSEVITPCEDKVIDPTEFTEVEDADTAEMLRSKAALIEKALGENIEYGDNGNDEPLNDEDEINVLEDEYDTNPGGDPNPTNKTEDQLKNGPSSSKSRPISKGGDVKINVVMEKGREINELVQDSDEGCQPQEEVCAFPKRPSDIPVKSCVDDDSKPELLVDQKLNSSAVPGNSQAELTPCEEAMENLSIDYVRVNQKLAKLPSPAEFGDGNPFLMFVCLTLLVQHRDHIMANKMDYNDLAMHFDKMVRKHDVHKVASQARTLYANYLKTVQSTEGTKGSGTPSSDDVSV